MKVEILEVAGIIPAMQALRLPYGKEPRSSKMWIKDNIHEYDDEYITEIDKREYINKEDIALAQKLIKAGDEHAKVLRGCIAYMKITAPRYFFQELNTYRIGCECLSSTSTMHTITKGVTPEMFDCDLYFAETFCNTLNPLIETYNQTKDTQPKDIVEYQFINIKKHIPECFLQTRIFAISYQTIRRIWRLRRNHRLPEWACFIDACRQLPFANELIFVE